MTGIPPTSPTPVCPGCRREAGLPPCSQGILVDIRGQPDGRSPARVLLPPASAWDPGSWTLIQKECFCGRHCLQRFFLIALMPMPKDRRRLDGMVGQMAGYGWILSFVDPRGAPWTVEDSDARRAFEGVLEGIEAETRLVDANDAEGMSSRRQCAIDRRAMEIGVYVFAAIDVFRPSV